MSTDLSHLRPEAREKHQELRKARATHSGAPKAAKEFQDAVTAQLRAECDEGMVKRRYVQGVSHD